MLLYNPNISFKNIERLKMNEQTKAAELELYKMNKINNERAIQELKEETGITQSDVEEEMKEAFVAYHKYFKVSDKNIQRMMDDFRKGREDYVNRMEKQL